jgi:hypothetical protein
MADEDAEAQAQQPLNREQRRAQKFHRASHGRQDNLLTQRQNNTGFLSTRPDAVEEEATEPPTEQAEPTEGGAGTGGATESAERVRHHEGQHLGNLPNS